MKRSVFIVPPLPKRSKQLLMRRCSSSFEFHAFELRGCYVERRALLILASRPYCAGPGDTPDWFRPGDRKLRIPRKQDIRANKIRKKSHASDLSSVSKVCTEKKKLLSNQYKSKRRLPRPRGGRVKLRSLERKISRHKKTAAKVGRASN